VLLDGLPALTPGRRIHALPTVSLAEVAAAEWAAQVVVVDPSTMPLTRLAAIARDAVEDAPEPVRAEVVKYARSDLLCYRATEPEGLVARQAGHWDPVLAWALERHDLRFVLSDGVIFKRQPEATLAKVAAIVARFSGLELAALQSMTTLSGSALLALAVADGLLDPEAAWAAAHVDEDWNIMLWGRDEEAAARREHRFAEFKAAARVVA
jgi:chaperone required for assembly of F1-ATPase